MAITPVGRVVRYLRRLAEPERAGEPTDGQLLRRFVSGEEEAFALLVRRHGPMVLGVCRRVLGNASDADDAFQATFLVLARGAGKVRQSASLAGWLYRVAFRAARKMKSSTDRRRLREQQAGQSAPPDPYPTWTEVRAVLDEELARLPERERQPLVMCYLQGLTQEEAAARLGWPRGTLKRRLEKGRDVLRHRLLRRGLGPAAAAWVAVGAEQLLAGTVPDMLKTGTVAGAAAFAAHCVVPAGAVPAQAVALAEGVMRTMFATKLKLLAGAALAMCLAATGTVLLAGPLELPIPAPSPPPSQAQTDQVVQPEGQPPAVQPQPPDAPPVPPQPGAQPPQGFPGQAPGGAPGAAPPGFPGQPPAADPAPKPAPKPAGVELKLVAKKTDYVLNTGGRTVQEYQKLLTDFLKRKPNPANPVADLPAEPPQVDLVLQFVNNAKKDVTLFLEGDGNARVLTLRGPGVVALQNPGPFTLELRLPRPVTLAPGDSYSLPIRQLFDGMRWRGRAIYWTAPGDYTLTASYGLSDQQGGPGARLQSQPIKLTVTAPKGAP
jgi:RNA polymerase sigma-70 factor (ECF subfamily)